MQVAGGSILVVDDAPDIREILKDSLEALGHRVFTASTGEECLEIAEREALLTILLDIELPDRNGLDVLEHLRKRGSDATVVMITAYGTIERAVEAMKKGAYDVITKPFELDHVLLVVGKALERERLTRGVAVLAEEAGERYRLVGGKSARMRDAIETARRAANSRSTVLLLGESGTGKEVFARAIHNWSERRHAPFVAINCVGLSKDLLESELFGHEKGAFTGAHQLKKGRMELAHGGTVFLDEIGDVSPDLQTKLLRFLQEREFERVGGAQPIRVDVRIIAATNRQLESAVTEGRFREDLYYRLNVIPIALPPLREIREDIPALAEYFLRRFARETKKHVTGMADDAEAGLLAYQWPGNVRELANIIERAVVLGEGPRITRTDLPSRVLGAERMRPDSAAVSYREALNAARRELILAALARAQGNQAAAAKALGLHPKYLSRLMKSLRMD
jgi:DNA-binding NtrC family response regulator